MMSKKESVSSETSPLTSMTPMEELNALIARVQAAQRKFSTYSQQQVDAIFRAASIAANAERITLAKEAVTETGMGIVEDKVIKNHFAAEYIYNKYRTTQTCGVIEFDPTFGIEKVAEPVGVICGIIPTTNPTSTTIFKSLIALKTRNAIIFSPHPRAKQCTVHAAKIILDAAVKAGAPADIIGWIENPTIELANALMTHSGINLILATGGPGMVKAAYSSGIPAIGVGAGNTPALIDETADIRMAVNSILMSKTFDNGVVCASEQCLVVHTDVYDEVIAEFKSRDGYVLSKEEKASLAAIMINPKSCAISPAIVGQSAPKIAEMAGIQVPPTTKLLIAEIDKVVPEEAFAHEKLSPVLGIMRCTSFEQGIKFASQLVELGGIGHTSVIYTDKRNHDRIHQFGTEMRTGRVLSNMPSSQGAIGDIYNFRLEPSLTLGCGSWGGNSVSENVGVKHLMNIKTVAERRENMLWFRVPPKIYLKSGCLPVALQDLTGKKRAFIITDSALFNLGFVEKITSILEPMGIECECFHQVQPDPTLSTVQQGVALINAFKPDVVIALGGGSPMDAAKIIWMLYEHPEVDFEGLSLRFMDIRKRIYTFPLMGQKAMMVAIPTTSGTGSEVTPFAVITDDRSGLKYPIADYSLTPDIAIVDADLVRQMPKSLVAAGGFDAIVHNIEAIVSVTATDYTTGIALESLRVLFKYLQRSFDLGAEDLRAQEKVHNASTMAGMAFANAFLGICHSMAHKLGAEFHIPHGIANALLLPTVVRFNATDNPTKQAAFPQYRYPGAIVRYTRIADFLNLGGDTSEEKIEALINALEDMKTGLKIPRTIQEYGIPEKEFLSKVEHLAEEAFDDQCTGTNPRYPLISELRELYLKAYYGK